MKVLRILNEKYDFIEIEDLDNINKYLGLDSSVIISSSTRQISKYDFYFRCFHRDYYTEDDEFISCINSDNSIDIPGECLILLLDNLNCDEFLTINSIVQRVLEDNMGYYINSKGNKQPCLKW